MAQEADTRRAARHSATDDRTGRRERFASLLKSREPRAHLTLTILWTLAIVPTIVWWKDSVLWVALMSLWANIASHWAAYAASRAAKASE